MITGWTPRIGEVLGRMPYSSNATLLARTTDGELVIYKPNRGERPLWDFATGTLSAREVLTFEVSALAGLDVVPDTVMVDGPYGAGSVQRFIDEDTDFDPAPPINRADPSLWPIAVLDLLVNNADRKAGHILRDETTGHLWSIDHGVTFHEEPKLRTVLWSLAGCHLPDEMIEAVGRFQHAMADGFHARVTSLLSDREAEALADRVGDLVAEPIHPDPPYDRPAMPWPLY